MGLGRCNRHRLLHVSVLIRTGRTFRRYHDTRVPFRALTNTSARSLRRAETTMSNPNLPAELLDHIVDHLHDTGDALINCCVVSKSWIARARKHLFAEVWFKTEDVLESWKETFPDPSTSPGRYANSLSIDCLHAVTAADSEAGGWIKGFSDVVHLKLGGRPGTYHAESIFLVPLQGFSPAVKSLSLNCVTPSPHIFDLVLSFPLLEDLSVIDYSYMGIHEDDGPNGLPAIAAQRQLSNPPAFTGSFKLVAIRLTPIARQLLSLPSGIHFRKLTLSWGGGEDISLMTALVGRCSHTLQSLDICSDPFSASILRLRPYQ